MQMNLKLAMIAASAALAACGGGGGGGGGDTVAPAQFVARDYAFTPTLTSNPVGVVVFAIDPNTGAPSAVAGSPFAAGTGTVDVAVDPTCRFVYAANGSS